MRRALFQVFKHSGSHIERLAAAYSLARAKFFHNPRAFPEFYLSAESVMV
jgi:hypothetical protein